MAPTPNATKSKGKTKEKKEKIFHPQSRKAGQLQRAQLRKSRLASSASKKTKKEAAKGDLGDCLLFTHLLKIECLADTFVFFHHAIPPEAAAVTLATLHDIVRDVWLKRHDAALEAERSARRKGRPKSARQMMLEEIILREAEDYRTGLGMRPSTT
jgi:translation machinery-associated protein 16